MHVGHQAFVKDALRQRIIDECLVAYMHDTQDAWDLQADGSYQRVQPAARSRQQGAQAALMLRYGMGVKALAPIASDPAQKSRKRKDA